MKLAVVVPIGPNKYHLDYLEECFASIYNQTRLPDELVIVDDMAFPDWRTKLFKIAEAYSQVRVTYVQNPWLLGIAASFNIGIMYSTCDLMFMLGGDDRLLPSCLEQVEKSYKKHNDKLGYYYVDIVYNNGEQQSLACNAAAVTKELWWHTGGFPLETAVGAPDAALISILLAAKGKAGHLHRVDGGIQYWVRRHENQDTAKRGPYQGAILSVRNILTANWAVPQWGRQV